MPIHRSIWTCGRPQSRRGARGKTLPVLRELLVQRVIACKSVHEQSSGKAARGEYLLIATYERSAKVRVVTYRVEATAAVAKDVQLVVAGRREDETELDGDFPPVRYWT